MIQRHFDEELAELKTNLARMAGLAEDQIDKALTALVSRDSALGLSRDRTRPQGRKAISNHQYHKTGCRACQGTTTHLTLGGKPNSMPVDLSKNIKKVSSGWAAAMAQVVSYIYLLIPSILSLTRTLAFTPIFIECGYM